MGQIGLHHTVYYASQSGGIKYLMEDKLLRQIVECFNELDQVSASKGERQWLTRSTSGNPTRSQFSLRAE